MWLWPLKITCVGFLSETKPMGGFPSGMAWRLPPPPALPLHNAPVLRSHHTDLRVQSIRTRCQLHFLEARLPVAVIHRLEFKPCIKAPLHESGCELETPGKIAAKPHPLFICDAAAIVVQIPSAWVKTRDNCWSWIEPISEVSKAFSKSTL